MSVAFARIDEKNVLTYHSHMEKTARETKKKRVAYNIKRLRKERGWHVSYVAERVGLSETYIRQLESGHSGFGDIALEKMTAVFGCDISEFFRPEQTKDSPEKEKVIRLLNETPDIIAEVAVISEALARQKQQANETAREKALRVEKQYEKPTPKKTKLDIA